MEQERENKSDKFRKLKFAKKSLGLIKIPNSIVFIFVSTEFLLWIVWLFEK